MALDESTIRRMVLTELAKSGEKYIPIGVSARHVHLSKADIEKLFGSGHQLTLCRTISQPGQFAAQECVKLIGPKGTFEKVRVLGPARSETQVELAFSDVFKIGLKDIPVRMSGKLEGTPGIKLVGPKGEVTIDHGVIVAARHIHMSPSQAEAYGVQDGMVVSVRAGGIRPGLMEDVICRVGNGHTLELHLDTDEANACAIKTGDYVELVLPGSCSGHCSGGCSCGKSGGCSCGKSEKSDGGKGKPKMKEKKPVINEEILDLVVERNIDDARVQRKSAVYCGEDALITPSAADRAAELGVRIVRVSGSSECETACEIGDETELLELVTEADMNEAYLSNKKEIYCCKKAVITDAAMDRSLETGIKILRV